MMLMPAVSLRKSCLALTLSLVTALFASSAFAQGAVVQSQGFTPGQAEAQASTSSNDALSLLLEQNQQLRTELQALRGLVEEQGFELRKMQRDSLNRYTNMDERLSSLESGAVTPAITSSNPGFALAGGSSANTTDNSPRPIDSNATVGAGPGTANVTPRAGNRAGSRGTLQPAVLSEQQLYQMAYDSVINSNFERSIAEFDQYLSIYPAGRFLTNAYYWKGQAYLYLNQFEQARDSYNIILDQFSDSAKLPDAMYGLALAYQGLGNIAQARQLLTEIKRRFPNTGVANLADTRLLSLD